MDIDLKSAMIYEQGVPWAAFAQLRRECPVYWNAESDGAGFWAVTRHADIVEVSRNPGLFSSAHENGGHRIFNENEVGLTNAGEQAIGIPFISSDPPLHTQYRKHIMPAVSPARLQGIENRIRERARTLIDAIPMGEAFDHVPALSAPLPLMTLCELLDLPPQMWTELYEWTNAFVGEDDPDFRQSPEAMARTLESFMGFSAKLFEQRRTTPSDDIATLLANMQIDGQPVPMSEFVGNLILALVGANETTRNSMSHTIRAFAENPDQWDLIREDPSRLKKATGEMVRYASPVLHMRRTATADTKIRGQKIAKGDKVVMWYASGNRDEEVFENPQGFDVLRQKNPHVGFGSGQHVCVGSRLAEMQLRVVFELLAERVARFEIIGEPRRFRSNFLNGLKNLDTVYHPA